MVQAREEKRQQDQQFSTWKQQNMKQSAFSQIQSQVLARHRMKAEDSPHELEGGSPEDPFLEEIAREAQGKKIEGKGTSGKD